jgi:hypothetical protein
MNVWSSSSYYIGLTALSYLYERAILRRYSMGVEQVIYLGEVTFMISGR